MLSIRSAVIGLSVLLIITVARADNRSWKPLVDDGLHDPESDAIEYKQNPEDALRELPPDIVGNKVRWVQALQEGYITPRTNILPGTDIKVLDLDIIMGNTGEMPMVNFPHLQHTEWLDCSNCHEKIFIKEVDANPITMMDVLMGEYCGRCHGAVAFPLTECKRCHSIDRSTFTGNLGAQY